MRTVSRSTARAGPFRRSMAFFVDLIAISMITSLCGIVLATATQGSVRVRAVIGSRIDCIGDKAGRAQIETPPNTKVDQALRCTEEIAGAPYDWSLDIRARAESDGEFSSPRVITLPLDPAGRVTDAFYLDSVVILLFGIYAFLAEYRLGTTLGKRLLGIRVRTLSGSPIDWSRAAKRALVRMAAFAPSIAAAAFTTSSVAFAWWLYEHTAWKIVGSGLIAIWLLVFAINYIRTTMRGILPWHDQWAETEVVVGRVDHEPRGASDLPMRSPVPPWLMRE